MSTLSVSTITNVANLSISGSITATTINAATINVTTINVTTINVTSITTSTGVPVGAANVQTFNASGTWTKPSGYSANSRVYIQAWGGGGSGGRNTVSGRGGGGGGGGYIEAWLNLSQLGATETVTIGAGGVSRTGSDQAGANGNPTTVGSLISVGAGAGGASAVINQGGGGGGPLSGASGTTPGNPRISAGLGFTIQNIGSGCTTQYAVVSVDPAFVGEGSRSRGSSSFSGISLDGPMEGFWHGGGGGGTAGGQGGNSVFGGAGGGSSATGTTPGGTSSFGGNGGAGGVTGTAGSQPGGGGGGGTSTSGAGGAGRVIISIFPA